MTLVSIIEFILKHLCKKQLIMKTGIYTQHQEHTEWLSKLSFYNDEILIMQERIEEIASKNTSKEVTMQIEHFQNQILIQKDNINTLKHDVERDEKKLQAIINENPVAVDHKKIEDHKVEIEGLVSFENNFNNLRKELDQFLSKYM